MDDPRAESQHDREIRLVLCRLSRAVQRATTYPAEHPSVHQAVDALHQVAAPLLGASTLSVIVARDRLLAAHGTAPPAAHSVPWLSARLHDCGIAALSVGPGMERENLARLVAQLAAPGEITDAHVAAAIPGARLTRFDWSRARFRDRPDIASADLTEAEFVWGAIANALAADWCVTRPDPAAPPDPADLADQVRASIAAREGTGVADLGARVIAQGGRLAQLPDPVRHLVRRKLAAFVARLAPELRGQLLRVVPTDDPAKLNLLVELIDALPSHDMLEVMQGVDLEKGGVPRQFVNLLQKLIVLAASGGGRPAPGPAADRSGLAAHLLPSDDSQLRGLLAQLFSRQTGDCGWVPDSYRARIDALAVRLEGSDEYAISDLENPSSRDAISAHVNRIATHQLVSAPSSEGSVAFLRRLRDRAPSELDAGNVVWVGQVAEVVERTARTPDLPAEAVPVAKDYLTFCRQRHTIAAALAGIERTGTPSSALLTLLRLGGEPAAAATVARCRKATSDVARERLGTALALLPTAVYDAVILPQLDADPSLARVMLGVMPGVDPRRGRELAHTLATHADADVRIGALEQLFRVPRTGAQFDRLLRQALGDADPRVVALGVERARARRPPGGFNAMTAFLAHARGPEVVPFQQQIVQLLRQQQTPEARDVLADALIARTRALDAASRQVSLAIRAALQTFPDGAARGAVRAWHRSCAGILSRVLGEARRTS